MDWLAIEESEENFSGEIGGQAPDFQLEAADGAIWRLSAHLGEVVALLFYPKDETLVCTRQLCSVRDNWAEYLATKATIVGVSPGTKDEHKSFAQRHRLPIPLLADIDRTVTEKYASHWLYPTIFMRGIIIVDAKGIVRSRKTMLRAFRPTDRSVIAMIYAARAEALHETYTSLTKKN